MKELALAKIGTASQIRFPDLVCFYGVGEGVFWSIFFFFGRIFKYTDVGRRVIMRTHHLV